MAGLLWAVVASGADAVADQGAVETSQESWVDSSHAYATDRVQDLARWMDGFFGDPNYDLDQPESVVRLRLNTEWDDIDGSRDRVRLRGKLRLPNLSERVNVVFSEDDGDEVAEDRLDDRTGVGVLFNVEQRQRSRVDLTMGLETWGLRPGVRYRNQGPIVDDYSYRYTQQLEWEDDEGFYTTGQVNLDHALAEDRLLRLSNRAVYGEETDGVEWRSVLSLSQRLRQLDKRHQLVVSYFTAVRGVTDPSYVKNYQFGINLRRQVYRDFLFAQLEPAYNFRKGEDQTREGSWSIALRLELVLARDLKYSPVLRRPPEPPDTEAMPEAPSADAGGPADPESH